MEIPGQMPLFDMPEPERTDQSQQWQQALREIQQENKNLVAQLARYKRRPDPSTVILTRLNLMLELAFADNPEARLDFEIQFEREMNHLLSGWVDQAAQQSLLDPGTPLSTNGRPLIGGNGFIAP